MPKFRLSELDLDEISLVLSGDNHGAKVVIAKANPDSRDVNVPGTLESADTDRSGGKVSKDDANYRQATSDRRCGNCRFFDGDSSCSRVAGIISADMVSDIYQPKVSKDARSKFPSLERVPGTQNWVDRAGGLPSYIDRIARHLHFERGMTISRAIATAVNRVKKWASGVGNVKPDTRAKAAKAVAQWEAKKIKGRVKKEWLDELELLEARRKRMGKAKVKKEDQEEITDEELEEVATQEDLDKSEESADAEGSLSEQQSDEEEDVGKTDEEITKDDLPSEVVEYIEKLEEEVTRLQEIEKDSKDDDDGDVDPFRAVLDKADPAVRSYLEKQEQRLKEAEEIAKAERDERLRREFLAKANDLRMISESPDDLASLLRKLHERAPEEAAEIEKILGAANKQIAKSNLFAEFGSGGAETTISKSVEGRAEALMKADPNMTREQAIAKVYEMDPALYDEVLKEG